jgi:transcription elongation factor GreA
MKKFQITKEGYENLKKELDHLKNNERPAIIEQIAQARDHGDLKENAEYHSAREKQGIIEAQIRDLEDKFSRSEVINVKELSGDKVIFGATVTLEDLDSEKVVKYKIVSDYEADIDKKMISSISPVASAILNKNKGEEVDIRTPGGVISYEIINIEFV